MRRAPIASVLEGIDVFVRWEDEDRDPVALSEQLRRANGEGLQLTMITNRGQKVWPHGAPETFCTDHWRCRFLTEDAGAVHDGQRSLFRLLQRLDEVGLEIIKMEFLYRFGTHCGYSAGQGQ